jgi:hypothetical protein
MRRIRTRSAFDTPTSARPEPKLARYAMYLGNELNAAERVLAGRAVAHRAPVEVRGGEALRAGGAAPHDLVSRRPMQCRGPITRSFVSSYHGQQAAPRPVHDRAAVYAVHANVGDKQRIRVDPA